MDCEQKYKEALERATIAYKDEDKHLKATLERIFPELKESEDEKIREDIIWCLKHSGIKENNPINPHVTTLIKDAIAWLEKQGKSYTKRDVDDAYLKGVCDAKNELERQYEADYQIRKDIATFIFNYRGDIKDRAKWMNYLGIKVSLVEKQGEKPQGKTALEAIQEEKEKEFDEKKYVKDWLEKNGGHADKVEPTAWSEEDETSIAINNPEAYRIGFADGEAHAKEEMTVAWSEEDERIKRNIIAALKGEGYYDCDLTNECIAWLDKQGKNSPIFANSVKICKNK